MNVRDQLNEFRAYLEGRGRRYSLTELENAAIVAQEKIELERQLDTVEREAAEREQALRRVPAILTVHPLAARARVSSSRDRGAAHSASQAAAPFAAHVRAAPRGARTGGEEAALGEHARASMQRISVIPW